MTQTDQGTQVVRRHLGTLPGTSLLLGEDAVTAALGLRQWCTETEMGPGEVSTGTLCAAPLPIPRDEGPRPYWWVNPAALWHPLFWLPERLATPYTITDEDGEIIHGQTESEWDWSIRVGLEMILSGLYDSEHGWVDILAPAGIDVTDPAGLARVATWQTGAPDEVLDAIELDAYLYQSEDPWWSARTAAELSEVLADGHWAMLADSLLELVLEAAAEEELTEARRTMGIVGALGAVMLAECPTPPGMAAAEELFDRVDAAAAGWAGEHKVFLDGPVAAARDFLSAVRDQYWPAVEAYQTIETIGQ